MSARPFHHQRPLAAAAAAYGLGVWAGVSFVWDPFLAFLGLALSGALCALFRGKGRIAGAMTLCLMTGVLLGGWAGHPWMPPEGRYQVTGVLSADTVLREDGTAAAYLEKTSITGEEHTLFPGKLYWTYTPDEDDPFLPREGERVTFSGRIYHPQGQVNPYGFDFRMFLLQKGVVCGVSGAAGAESLGRPGRGAASVIYGIRQGMQDRLRSVFGESSALPEALLLGQRSQLPEETAQGFADAGAAHLLAVSGLHVGLLAGLLLLLIRKSCKPGVRCAVLSVFLLCYCALLDFSAPVTRASLLLLITQGHRIVRRAYDPLTALCAAFFVILVFRPLDLFSASFQLSFGAVLGMVCFSRAAEKHLAWIPVRFLRDGVRATVTATVGTVLPTIQIFHRVSLIGLLVNPLLCALFAVLLPAYAAVLIVGLVYLPFGAWLGTGMGWITDCLIRGIEAMGKLPFATVRVPSLPWYCVIALVFAAALATRYTLLPRRRKAVLAAAALILSFGAWNLTLCRDVQYVQLAMGQSDAALILDGGETVVIDAGKYGGDVAAYLLSTGRNADRVILTHLHSDHCMGVMQLVENRVPIGKVYLPEGAEEEQVDALCVEMLGLLEEKGISIEHLYAGQELKTQRTALTVTWPWKDAVRPGQDANRYSLALLCDLDGLKLLTTGDLTGDYEMYGAMDADVLKVAHHGSKNSTGDDFLSAVSPQIALITGSGQEGSSLPHPDTLERLKQRGIAVYDTGENGALTLTVRGGQGIIRPYLHQEEDGI